MSAQISGPYWLSCEAQRMAEHLCDRVAESSKLESEAIDRWGMPDGTLRIYALGRYQHFSPWNPAYDTIKRDYCCEIWDAKHFRWRHFAF